MKKLILLALFLLSAILIPNAMSNNMPNCPPWPHKWSNWYEVENKDCKNIELEINGDNVLYVQAGKEVSCSAAMTGTVGTYRKERICTRCMVVKEKDPKTYEHSLKKSWSEGDNSGDGLSTGLLVFNDPGIYTIIFKIECEKEEKILATNSVTIYVIGIRIKNGSTYLTNKKGVDLGLNIEKVVGQQVGLTAELVFGANYILPSDITREDGWTLGGTVIKDYDATTAKGEVIKLGDEDKKKSSVTYYYVNGGKNTIADTVTLKKKNTDGTWKTLMTLTANTNINSIRPTATMTAKTLGVGQFLSEKKGKWGMSFGDMLHATTNPGIKFNSTIDFMGTTQYVQKINTFSRKSYRYNGNVLQDVVETNALDNGYPYATGLETLDAPGGILTVAATKLKFDDSYTMWLMFKPKTSNSIWIPLRKIDWNWSGEAEILPNGYKKWKWKKDSIKSSWSKDPKSIDTLEYPEWTKSFSN